MIRQGFVNQNQFLKDLTQFDVYPENPNALEEFKSMLVDLGIPKSTNPLAPKNVILQQANGWAEQNELPIKFINRFFKKKNKIYTLSHTIDIRHVVLLDALLAQHVAVFVDALHHHAAIGLQSCIHHLLVVLWQTNTCQPKQSRRQQSRSGAVPPTASKQRRLFAHNNQMTNK